MSIIGKKPFINTILDSLTKTQIQTLEKLIDKLEKPILVSLYGQEKLLSQENIGVSYVTLKMEELSGKICNGILCYTGDDYCGFFVFREDNAVIEEYKINPKTRTFARIYEYLTAEELRRTIDDILEEKESGNGGHFTEDVVIALPDSTIGVEPGLSVAGKAEFKDSVSVEKNIIINSKDNLVDKDGNPLIEGGIPDATKPNQVIVSDENNKGQWVDVVPKANNLQSAPIVNDALYLKGPTGGNADIYTGEESYLQNIKGYAIVLNNVLPTGSTSFTTKNDRVYLTLDTSNNFLFFIKQSYNATNLSWVIDLTKMFGGNDNIPFELSGSSAVYKANGTWSGQSMNAYYRFVSILPFLNKTYNVVYGEDKLVYVNASKLVEIGQNLWNEDDEDMVNNGLELLPGRYYEIIYAYSDQLTCSPYTNMYKYSIDGGQNWSSGTSITKYELSNNNYAFFLSPQKAGTRIKSINVNKTIKYVGLVHSGNYTQGFLLGGDSSYIRLKNSSDYDKLPKYKKIEYELTGINDLKGIPDSSTNHCSVYDERDIKRVGEIDLSTLTWTQADTVFAATISDIKDSTTAVLAEKYLQSEISVGENGLVSITTDSTPTGKMIYELAVPIKTGLDKFEPIQIEVNDMGIEWFEGTTECPINQIAYYYQNLKDKLVNLNIQTISAFTYDYYSSTQGTNAVGIVIDGEKYNFLPYSISIIGTATSGYHALSIGPGATNDGSYGALNIGSSSKASASDSSFSQGYCVAVGNCAEVSGQGVAIGYDAAANYSNSIALGYKVETFARNTFSYGDRTLENTSLDSIYFRNISTLKRTYVDTQKFLYPMLSQTGYSLLEVLSGIRKSKNDLATSFASGSTYKWNLTKIPNSKKSAISSITFPYRDYSELAFTIIETNIEGLPLFSTITGFSGTYNYFNLFFNSDKTQITLSDNSKTLNLTLDIDEFISKQYYIKFKVTSTPSSKYDQISQLVLFGSVELVPDIEPTSFELDNILTTQLDNITTNIALTLKDKPDSNGGYFCVPTYRAIITTTQPNIVVTVPETITKFKTDNTAVTYSTGALTLPTVGEYEINITDNKLRVVDWGE